MTDKRVAFVTGGSRGIGAAIVKRLAKDGLHVIAVARSADKLQQVCDEVKAEGGSAEPESGPTHPGTVAECPVGPQAESLAAYCCS